MTVKEAREIVLGMELSAEGLARVEQILGKYGENDEIPDALIDEILLIVDGEIDANQLAADIYQSGVELADEFLGKVDGEANKINEEINSVVVK